MVVLRGRAVSYGRGTPIRPLREDWYFNAKQPAPAPHLALPEGCAALRFVLLTVHCVSRSREHFPPPTAAGRSCTISLGGTGLLISALVRPPPSDHHGALGICLLQGPRRWHFLMSEAPLYARCREELHDFPPPPLGPPRGPRHMPTAGSWAVAFSYERGTPAHEFTRRDGAPRTSSLSLLPPPSLGLIIWRGFRGGPAPLRAPLRIAFGASG